MSFKQQLLALQLLWVSSGLLAQGAVVTPPPSLVIDGVPVISTSLADSIDRYGDFRRAVLLDWHPSNHSILLHTRFAETPQLHLVSVPGGDRRQLTFFKDAVRAALFHPNGGDYLVYAKDAGGGDERDPKMREFLERIAPMNNVGKIRKPMLVVAGRNDPRVPVSESDQIVAALRNQGTPVWYIAAKDEGHGFQKKPNQDYQLYATVKFLGRCLDIPQSQVAAVR